jgi:hypothetical protein
MGEKICALQAPSIFGNKHLLQHRFNENQESSTCIFAMRELLTPLWLQCQPIT